MCVLPEICKRFIAKPLNNKSTNIHFIYCKNEHESKTNVCITHTHTNTECVNRLHHCHSPIARPDIQHFNQLNGFDNETNIRNREKEEKTGWKPHTRAREQTKSGVEYKKID